MGLKVHLHRRAQFDLQSIRDYLLQHTAPRSAERVRIHLMRKIAQLAKAPQIGTATSNPKIRILPPTRYPYRIYYTITDAAVVILHIRHSARQEPDADETSDFALSPSLSHRLIGHVAIPKVSNTSDSTTPAKAPALGL